MTDTTAGAGLMVLGMHRSGTSALSRVLQLGGADIGERVTGASRGNEGGHWEDAFAMATHERLLAAFGAAWDEPFALPDGWWREPPADDARAAIADYLATTRARHACWSVKDPRMCHFGGLWRDAAVRARLPLSAIVAIRHPLEVAASLAERDGIDRGTALLLWLEHTQSALAIAETMPSCVLAYASLLDDWRGCVPRVRALAGGDALDFDGAAGAIDAYLDRGLRHHREPADDALPADIAVAWQAVSALATSGAVPQGATEAIESRLSGSIGLARGHALRRRQSTAALLRALSDASDGIDQGSESKVPVDAQHATAFDGLVATMRRLRTAANTADAAANAAEARMNAATAARETAEARAAAAGAHVSALESDLRASEFRAATAESRAAGVETRADAEMQRAVAAETRALASEARIGVLGEIEQGHARLQADVARCQRTAAESEEALAAANGRIGELQDALAAAEARHAAERRDASTQMDRRHAHQVEASAMEASAATRRQAAQLQAAMTAAEDRLRREREALASLLSSRSWRWSLPLRIAGRLLRGEWGTLAAGWRRRDTDRGPST